MDHATASPHTPTQPGRMRRWSWALPVCALALLAACGGSSHDPLAPTALSYDTEQALYVVGEPITANNARLTGGDSTTTFAAAPALPGGLTLDARSGLITGTPTTLQRQASYTVTASNGGGSAQTQVRVTVTGRGAWSAVSTIPDARHYATLSPLTGGRILAAGGMTASGPTGSAYLYDASTATWSPAAPMLIGRSEAMAVVLLDGRVLVFGGDITGNTTTAAAEIYDPVANTWTATSSMNQARTRSTATLLGDGKVLVTGGYARTPATVFRNTAELYDPATGIWTLLPLALSTARAQHAAALLPGGNTLLLAGGVNSSGFVTTAEIYAVDGSTTTVIPYGGAGNVHQAVSLDDDSVLVMSDGSTTALRFNPGALTWTPSTMSAARNLPTMTLLADGRVLVAGGSSLDTAEIYNPDVNRWTAAAPMAAVRRAAVAALLGDGRVLVVGGFDGGGEVDGSERYTP